MKSSSFFWVSDELTGNPPIYLRQYYPVTVCTLEFLLQRLMQPQTIVPSPSFIILGPAFFTSFVFVSLYLYRCIISLIFTFLTCLSNQISKFFESHSLNCKVLNFCVSFACRASPSEFVIPLAKYYKSVYSHQPSLGMRFRMMFETEDSGTRRYVILIESMYRKRLQ